MTKLTEYIKAGFGMELGAMAVNALVLGVALLFFIPAVILHFVGKGNGVARIGVIVLSVLGTCVLMISYGGLILSIVVGHVGGDAISGLFSSSEE